MIKHKQIFRFLTVIALCVTALSWAVAVQAQNVTTGYQTDESLQKGMIIRLKDGDSSKVQALTQKEVPDMLGVIVASSDAPVSLSDPGAASQVFVATYGQYDVLVSTQAGVIREGDFITISSVRGVGMKAETTQELVIGKALANFDGKTDAESKVTLETNNGKKEVSLGRIPVEVSVAHNPLYEEQGDAEVPEFLSKAVQLISDRPINAFRIYASLAILILCTIVGGSILYAGVRSGMAAIGRNPLAKHSIIRNLVQVTIMSLIIFLIGVLAVYLLLRI